MDGGPVSTAQPFAGAAAKLCTHQVGRLCRYDTCNQDWVELRNLVRVNTCCQSSTGASSGRCEAHLEAALQRSVEVALVDVLERRSRESQYTNIQ